MKKYTLILLALLLTGCQTVGSWPEFPKAESSLLKKCPELIKLDESQQVTITEMMNIVVKNYMLYHQCSGKVEDWQQWYEKQREAYESSRGKL
jgi:hypothetical protein